MENNKAVLFELNIENDRCIFPNTISDAIIDANKELKDLEDKADIDCYFRGGSLK